METISQNSFPSYKLFSNKIELDLKLDRKDTYKYQIIINFSEIDELEAYDSAGAMNITAKMGFSYTKLKIKGSNQLAKFMKGKIKRPEVVVFAINFHDPRFLHYLLIRGPKIYYFIPLGKQDGLDAVEAFKSFKEKEY